MKDKRYRRSQARSEALLRLRDLRAGAKEASRKSTPVRVRNMVYQSAIFLASSTLEEYLKQIFDHWLYELKRHGLAGANIPARARFSYVSRELSSVFNSYVHAGDEIALARKIEDRANLLEFAIGRSIIFTHLTGEFAYKDRKYPSPRNIKALYSRIGCDNIFQQLSRAMKADAELKLQAFNDIRTSMAHGSPPSLTIIDVNRNLDDVGIIIKSLDKINHREMSKDFGGGVW
jgi:hypothetical protein